jgi:hypothetical protein
MLVVATTEQQGETARGLVEHDRSEAGIMERGAGERTQIWR